MNQKYVLGGVIAGLVAGVAFGIVSQATGMMPMIAMLVKSQSTTVGWIVHLIISITGGIVFASVFGRLASTFSKAAGWGLLYGVLWWLFGMLAVMPVILGMPVEFGSAFDQMNIASLYGHLLWGVLLAMVFVLYKRDEIAIAPKSMWREAWPFAVIAILLVPGALAAPGSMQMGSSTDMNGGMNAHNNMSTGQMNAESMPVHASGTMPMQ